MCRKHCNYGTLDRRVVARKTRDNNTNRVAKTHDNNTTRVADTRDNNTTRVAKTRDNNTNRVAKPRVFNRLLLRCFSQNIDMRVLGSISMHPSLSSTPLYCEHGPEYGVA